MHPDFDLSGTTALVTGATRGLGQAIAHGLARAGADIVAASASQAPAGSDTQRLVESTGRTFTGLGCDFSDRSDTYRLVDELRRMDRPIDIVINNAGTIRRSPAARHGDDDWDRVLEVNLTAPFPVTNGVFTATLGDVLGRPTFMPIPKFGPKLLLGSELAENLLFTGQRVLPVVLEHDPGFEFAYSDLESALRALLES